MSLRLAERWVWDFWLARDGSDFHLFFLQAPRSISDPDQRHWNVSIGHAVSTDLTHWEVLPDALRPALEPAWDDYTTWTGSIVRSNGQWWMFYTGTSRSEQGKVQRIGAALSDDLVTWRRHDANPLIESDPRWYEQYDAAVWPELAWRDPWVFGDDTGTFHAFVTARAASGPPATRGVIGHATSTDLSTWTVTEPITTPGRFGHLEIPQVAHIDGQWQLIFSTPPAPRNIQQEFPDAATAGTHVLSAPTPLGPYDWSTHCLLDGTDGKFTFYGGRLIDDGSGWQLLTWVSHDSAGTFIGALDDPQPVRITPHGLQVRRGPGDHSVPRARDNRTA